MKNNIHDIDVQNAEEAGIRFYFSIEEQKLAYLKDGMKKTDEEKFSFMMHLMKTQKVIKEATSIKTYHSSMDAHKQDFLEL